MRNDNELRALLSASVNFQKQRQLSLRRQGCLRLIQQIQAVRPEVVLCKCQKGLPVRFLMVVLRNTAGSAAVFIFLRGNIVKTFRTQKIGIWSQGFPLTIAQNRDIGPEALLFYAKGVVLKKNLLMSSGE